MKARHSGKNGFGSSMTKGGANGEAEKGMNPAELRPALSKRGGFLGSQSALVRYQYPSRFGVGTCLLKEPTLRGKGVIIKGIVAGRKGFGGLHKESVDAWIKAYKHEWAKEGFDYNPIEPILMDNRKKYRIYRNKDNSYRVTAGIIEGVPLYNYHNHKRLEEVSELKERVKTAVSNILGINKQHIPDTTFVVSEEPIGNKVVTRVYLTFFDQPYIKWVLPKKASN